MSDLVDRVINAMKAADPDCADRHPDDLCDLAAVVIEAVRPYCYSTALTSSKFGHFAVSSSLQMVIRVAALLPRNYCKW